MIEQITREDIDRMLNSPALSIEDIVKIVKDELDIDVDTSLDREQIGDQVYKAYTTALKEVEENKQRANITLQKKRDRKIKKLTAKPPASQLVKDMIEQGIYTKDQIVDEITHNYPEKYVNKGKTAGQRVGRVIRELIRGGTVEKLADGVIRLKETK